MAHLMQRAGRPSPVRTEENTAAHALTGPCYLPRRCALKFPDPLMPSHQRGRNRCRSSCTMRPHFVAHRAQSLPNGDYNLKHIEQEGYTCLNDPVVEQRHRQKWKRKESPSPQRLRNPCGVPHFCPPKNECVFNIPPRPSRSVPRAGKPIRWGAKVADNFSGAGLPYATSSSPPPRTPQNMHPAGKPVKWGDTVADIFAGTGSMYATSSRQDAMGTTLYFCEGEANTQSQRCEVDTSSRRACCRPDVNEAGDCAAMCYRPVPKRTVCYSPPSGHACRECVGLVMPIVPCEPKEPLRKCCDPELLQSVTKRDPAQTRDLQKRLNRNKRQNKKDKSYEFDAGLFETEAMNLKAKVGTPKAKKSRSPNAPESCPFKADKPPRPLRVTEEEEKKAMKVLESTQGHEAVVFQKPDLTKKSQKPKGKTKNDAKAQEAKNQTTGAQVSTSKFPGFSSCCPPSPLCSPCNQYLPVSICRPIRLQCRPSPPINCYGELPNGSYCTTVPHFHALYGTGPLLVPSPRNNSCDAAELLECGTIRSNLPPNGSKRRKRSQKNSPVGRQPRNNSNSGVPSPISYIMGGRKFPTTCKKVLKKKAVRMNASIGEGLPTNLVRGVKGKRK